MLTPSVRLVVESIRANIESGQFAADTFLPSEHDLAASLGVSRGTVRQAIDFLVTARDLIRRPHSRPIIRRQQDLVYYRPAPEILAGGAEVHIWVSHPISDEPTMLFLRGLSLGFGGTPFQMVVKEPSRFLGKTVLSEERAFLKGVLENDAAIGAILQREPYGENSDLIRRLQSVGKYLVFVDTRPPNDISADHVGTANSAAAREAVQHLISLGHTSIACVTDSDVPFAIIDRIKGYNRAMDFARLGDKKCLILGGDLPIGEHEEYQLAGHFAPILNRDRHYADVAARIVKALLAMDPRPTGLFICYDILAFWICAYLAGSGLRVPEDFAIVGFDDLCRWMPAERATLTSACQDFAGFGRHAAELFIDRVEEPTMPARHMLLEAPLTVRSSTGSTMLMPHSGAAPDQAASGSLMRK